MMPEMFLSLTDRLLKNLEKSKEESCGLTIFHFSDCFTFFYSHHLCFIAPLALYYILFYQIITQKTNHLGTLKKVGKTQPIHPNTHLISTLNGSGKQLATLKGATIGK